MDMRELASASTEVRPQSRVLAPFRPDDRKLAQRIAALRSRGIVVIEDLPGHARFRAELGCDRVLVQRSGRWVVEKNKD
jgi:ATP phosphoribosyltransferase regulatory subunit